MDADKQSNVMSILQLQLLIESLVKWADCSDKGFIACWKNNLKTSKYVSFDVDSTKEEWIKCHGRDLLKTITTHISNQAIVQAFVYAYESINKNYLQFQGEEKQEFAKLRKRAIQGNLNNDQILNVIRQSIAHNDDEGTPNYSADLENGIFRFSLRGSSESIEITTEDMLKTLTYYITNIIDQKKEDLGVFYNFSAILNNQNKDIEDLIVLCQRDGETISPDEHQKNALRHVIQNIQLGNAKLSTAYRNYPFRNNNFNNSMNALALNSFMSLLNDCRGKNLSEMFDSSIAKNNLVLSTFTRLSEPLSLLFSNLLFTIFSSTNTKAIEQCSSVVGIHGDMRRVRNAIMHGTFYYDNKEGFEFYDGKRKVEQELEYVASLSFNEIRKLAQVITHLKMQGIEHPKDFDWNLGYEKLPEHLEKIANHLQSANDLYIM